jgi:hypothetical protein
MTESGPLSFRLLRCAESPVIRFPNIYVEHRFRKTIDHNSTNSRCLCLYTALSLPSLVMSTSSSSSKARPIPNVQNLHNLGNSSTGTWERGEQTINARSPPTHPAHLLQLTSSTLSSRRDAAPLTRPHLPNLPSEPTIRPGYAFHPRSGPSTPTTTGPVFSPFIHVPVGGGNARASGSGSSGLNMGRITADDDDDEDHPGRRETVDQLREGVKADLIRNGLGEDGSGIQVLPGTEGMSSLAIANGIADENGLGFAGMRGDSCSIDRC